MTFRLTVVVDNRAPEGLAAEHGFALHLETPDGNILFDTGQQAALLPNMERLGIVPEKIQSLVLSHGHYDHTGGVAEMLRRNRNIEVYLHGGVFQPRYCLDGEAPAIVRMPFAAMEAITRHPEGRVHWLTRPMSLFPSVGLTGPISRSNDFEDTGGPFYLDPEGREADTIKDDVAMWLHTPDGLVVCVGCCHSGLVNTLSHITARTGERRIAMIIGGLHLLRSSEQRLARTVEALIGFTIGRIIACHCSGEEAVRYLQAHLAAEVTFGEAGLVVEI